MFSWKTKPNIPQNVEPTQKTLKETIKNKNKPQGGKKPKKTRRKFKQHMRV